MIRVATFFSHYGAMRCKKLCDALGWRADLMPVPRSLSSSCGTCVRYEGGALYPADDVPDEVEQIVAEVGGGYEALWRARNS